MSEQYLWDRSGKPDQEIARLETLLGALRWSARRQRKRGWSSWMTWCAAAAVVVLIAGTALFMRAERRVPTPWQLMLANGKPAATHTGQVIETNREAGAILESDSFGRVDIGTDSRLRLVASRAALERFALDHGKIHALIWAPPARFVVDTPSAKTVDLGCQYTLQVNKDGTGVLTVETGWVAFEWRGVESFIPAGATCKTRPGHGPDTPYFLDAPSALVTAVDEFDRTGKGMALQTALKAARPGDGLTLWHLLQRTRGDERAEVFDRFAALVPLRSSVTRAAVLRGDSKAMDAAWDALQLGDTSWWREWKRNW